MRVGDLVEVRLPPSESRADAGRSQREAWILSTLPRALAYAASLLRDRSLVEDVVHDCYVRLLRKQGVYDLPRDGTRLLYKAITNACVDLNHRERTFVSLDRDFDTGSSHTIADERTPGPLPAAIGDELEEALASGLARLPQSQRSALELKSLGHSHREIAEALGTSESNAAVLVHRARKELTMFLGSFSGSMNDD